MRRISYMWLRWRLRMYRTRLGRWLPHALGRPVRHLLIFWLVLILGTGLVAVDRRLPSLRPRAAEAVRTAWRGLQEAAGELVPGLVSWAQAEGRLGEAALRQGLPAAVWETGPEPPPAGDWRRDVRAVVYTVTGYDLGQPHTLLEAAIPGLAHYNDAWRSGLVAPSADPSPSQASRGVVSIAAADEPWTAAPAPASPTGGGTADLPPVPGGGAPAATPAGLGAADRPGPAGEPTRPAPQTGARLRDADWRERLQSVQWGAGCRILIYHTHTSETYRTDSFSPADPHAYHLWNTTETGIVAVGRALKERLEAYGIPTCHSVAIHDWPSHPRAYIASRATVEQFLARNPNLELVLDVHRDAPEGLVATIGGRRVAQIAFVVGTNSAMQPRWRENLAFARDLGERLSSRYPGLFRRVIERPESRLNQDLHPRAVLVEVGSYDNHLEEALAAAELLGDVLAEVLAGILAGGADAARAVR